MNDKTLVEMLAGWSDSEFAVAASGEYCEDLKSRIEGELAKQADTIEAQATHIEALQLRVADLQLGIDYACRVLEKFEPGDSRAVSNEFVALAAIGADLPNDECRTILSNALEGKSND